MFAKLAFLIVSLGFTASILLATRQERLQAVHELTEVQRRVTEIDREFWRLRIDVAEASDPSIIEMIAEQFGELRTVETPLKGVDRIRRIPPTQSSTGEHPGVDGVGV